MKRTVFLLPALFFLLGCGLIWSPTATVKSFITAAQKGEVDKMTRLFSSKAIRKMGLDQVKSNNQSFAELHHRAPVAAGSYQMENIEETSTLEGKRVSFLYRNEAGTDSIRLVFDLSKEGSAWKIDQIGGADLAERTSLENPTPIDPAVMEEPPTPPPLAEKSELAKSGTKGKTVSGGVLNGKAISLPKPPYPAVARAAKASGTVVVQVVIDENGNVITAHAVSGHPLLQAACVAAARAAKFSPTKLSGQPVRVTGVVTYSFAPSE